MSLVTSIIPLLKRVEEGFHFQRSREWVQSYWMITIPISLLYLLVIFTIQSIMSSRQSFGLRRLLTVWNVGLAVFSFVGTVTCLPDLISTLVTHGLEYGNCNLDGITTQRLRLWTFMFMLSKVIELGDTLFIVLRKTPLSFLHWYHHITVLVYCWYSYQTAHEIGFWFGGMNYFIHTVMYTYYALRAMGFRVPSVVAQLITMLQIIQMFAGTILNLLSLRKSEVFDCDVPYGPAYFGLTIYITYMLLFLNFFYHRYIKRKPKTN